jgi:hypothetical protein
MLSMFVREKRFFALVFEPASVNANGLLANREES